MDDGGKSPHVSSILCHFQVGALVGLCCLYISFLSCTGKGGYEDNEEAYKITSYTMA